MPNKVEIELRGRKIVCPNFTDDHAMYFGTLIMSKEEIAIYVNDENPDRAFQMMSDRLQAEMLEVKGRMAGKTAQEIDDAVNLEFSKRTAARLMMRINQDNDPLTGGPGLRQRVAMRLREVFPSMPVEWVSEKGLNLDLQEIITTIAIPLYSYLGKSDKDEPETPTPAAATPIPVKLPDMPVTDPVAAVAPAILASPPASVIDVTPPMLPAQITIDSAKLDELPPELRQRLGI